MNAKHRAVVMVAVTAFVLLLRTRTTVVAVATVMVVAAALTIAAVVPVAVEMVAAVVAANSWNVALLVLLSGVCDLGFTSPLKCCFSI